MKKDKPKGRGLARKVRGLGRKKLVSLAACGTAGLGLAHQASAATLVTFGGFTADNVSIPGLPDYGDNVTANSDDYTVSSGLTGIVGTPDITLDWIGQWDTYTNWDGRGNVAQSDFNGGQTVFIMFNPSPVSAVRLVSFELDLYVEPPSPPPPDGVVEWEVLGSGIVPLASGHFMLPPAGGRTLFSPNVVGVIGEPISLSLMLTSGLPSYFALDNLTFDQVPEPSALTLIALPAAAVGAAAMRRRRHV